MDICISKTLKKLRAEKDCTQEQLANHLGISAQAVGKWERGEGYPDITLLPAIAMYFGITVDDLLDVGKARIDQKVSEYQNESHVLGNRGEVEKEYELWERAYAEFPNNEDVMSGRMYALDGMYNRVSDEEKKKSISAAIIEMGEKLLRSENNGKRESAVQILAYHYHEIGEKEKAVEYAKMGGSHWCTADELLPTIYDGEEAVKQCQYNINTMVDLMTRDAYIMQWQGDNCTHEEKAEIDLFCIKLIELVFNKRDYGFFACRMSEYYRYLSEEYAALGKHEECLDAVEKAAEFSILTDTQPDGQHTSILVNKLKYERGGTTKNYTCSDCRLTLDSLNNSVFDTIRDTPRFAAAVDKLKSYAKERDQ
ncbi:MAG: helix-turn-helix transcriptional regulator [Eubacteriales bacterium]